MLKVAWQYSIKNTSLRSGMGSTTTSNNNSSNSKVFMSKKKIPFCPEFDLNKFWETPESVVEAEGVERQRVFGVGETAAPDVVVGVDCWNVNVRGEGGDVWNVGRRLFFCLLRIVFRENYNVKNDDNFNDDDDRSVDKVYSVKRVVLYPPCSPNDNCYYSPEKKDLLLKSFSLAVRLLKNFAPNPIIVKTRGGRTR